MRNVDVIVSTENKSPRSLTQLSQMVTQTTFFLYWGDAREFEQGEKGGDQISCPAGQTGQGQWEMQKKGC